MKLKHYITTFTFLVTSFVTLAQTNISISDGTADLCSGVLFDTGGEGGTGYSNDENFTLTICPDVVGNVINLVFNNFNLSPTNTSGNPSNADNLTIYDGDDITATTLGTYTGNQLQGLVISATSFNTTGCITLVFTSNDAGTGSFSATITCETPCQPPTALFASPTVIQNPQKICQGETLTFDASASTAQTVFNIVDYIFEWGDGTTDTLQSPIATHTFNTIQEHLVKLTVVDNNDCSNLNSEIIIVWVSTTPNFSASTSDTTLCLGESACLDGVVTPVTYVPGPSSNLSGATYLPDEVGSCFTADLTFGIFNPGQTLDNINDLQSICINMEHSFMGDLVGSIICPNGTSVVLHQQGGSGTNLGDPDQADDPLIIGTGWDYCWSPTATNGTWEDNSTVGGNTNTITNSSGDESLTPDTYESLNPLTPLVGCPLNGIWQIEFCDLWGSDDGFVFNFSINFDPSLYPSLTTYTPSIGPLCDSTFWSATGNAASYITSTSADCNNICITPTTVGAFDYTFNALDDFGCSYDTTITVTVEPGPEVNAGNDTTICIGSTVQLNALPENVTACDFTLNLYDSFGDGWNGFSVELLKNGTSTGPYTIATGSDATHMITLNPGDIIKFNTVSGTFDAEVSYELLDCDGNVIFSDGNQFTGSNPLIGNNIFNTTIGGVFNYSWTPTTGLSDANIANPIATVNTTTNYYVEIWEPGHAACSSFDTVIVSIISAPFAGIDSTEIVCWDDDPFDMTPYLGTSADIGGVWKENGIVITNIFNPQTATPGTTYNYIYLMDNPTCPDSASFNITIRPLGDIVCGCPLNGYTTTIDEVCFGACEGEVLVKDSLGFAIDYSIDGLTWQVDSNFTNICAGNYTAYTRNPEYGPECIDTLHFVITTPPQVLISQIDSINETCFEDCDGEINITSLNADFYSIDNGVTFQTDSLFTNICVGEYVIITKDSADCETTGVVNITGMPKITIDFTANPQPTFVPYTEVTFTNNSEGQTENLWIVQGVDSFVTENLVYEFEQIKGEHQVCLTIKNVNDCDAEICQTIVIKEELDVYIPNAFTPDFNDKNETFKPVLRIEMVVEYNLQVYDRWGSIIFETIDPTQGWNGTINGGSKIAPTGTYVYQIKVKDTNGKYHNYTGGVNIIK